MQQYMGVKLIEATPADKDGLPGYNVIYPDGYSSWSPQDVFENAYLPMQVVNAITPKEVESMIATVRAQQIDPKTCLVNATLKTGFQMYATSACVDPANYSEELGMTNAMKDIQKNIWFAMGFVLQWAKYGLNHTNKQEA